MKDKEPEPPPDPVEPGEHAPAPPRPGENLGELEEKDD